MRPPPAGIYVPAVLFFTPDDELDLAAISEHILRLARGGLKGILVQGSNGEAQHLSHDERARAIRHTRKTLDDAGFCHVRIMAGTGAGDRLRAAGPCMRRGVLVAQTTLALRPDFPEFSAQPALLSHALAVKRLRWTLSQSAEFCKLTVEDPIHVLFECDEYATLLDLTEKLCGSDANPASSLDVEQAITFMRTNSVLLPAFARYDVHHVLRRFDEEDMYRP